MAPTVLVLDTNVLLHCKALVSIPWLERAGADEVLLVIPWAVYGELDEHASDDKQPGRKRRAIDRRNVIRDRKKKPILFESERVFLEVAKAPAKQRKNVDDAVLDEVKRQAKRKDVARAVLVTRDGAFADRAASASVEVLTLPGIDEEPISEDPSFMRRISDLEADLRRLEKRLDGFLATKEAPALLRLVSAQSDSLVFRVEWSPPALPTRDDLDAVVHRARINAARRAGGVPRNHAEIARYQQGQADAEVKAREDLRKRVAKARLRVFEFRLRVRNDGDGGATSVRVSLTLPTRFEITTSAFSARVLAGEDATLHLGSTPPAEVVTIEPADEGNKRLVYGAVEVHPRDGALLPPTWIALSPEDAPRVEVQARVTSPATSPITPKVVFEVQPAPAVPRSWVPSEW